MTMIVPAILLLRHKILERNLTCIYAHVRNATVPLAHEKVHLTQECFFNAKNIAEKKAARSRHLYGGPSLPIKKKKQKTKIKRK